MCSSLRKVLSNFCWSHLVRSSTCRGFQLLFISKNPFGQIPVLEDGDITLF
ncbi:hypothetical protein MKX03_022785, partial [Papaver bracteatum]